MSRHILTVSYEQLTSFDLDAFVAHAVALNHHHQKAFTTPFPKAPSRWLSHDQFTARPITLTPAKMLNQIVSAALDELDGKQDEFTVCTPVTPVSSCNHRRPRVEHDRSV